MPRSTLSLVLPLAVVLGGAVACYGSGGSSSSSSSPPPDPLTGPTAPAPGTVSSPSTYVAKVKNILVGLPPGDDEIKAVQADPTKLAELIDGWMKLPQYQTKMQRFFDLAFQQTQVSAIDFAQQVLPRTIDPNGPTQPLLVQNAKESFARTALALVTEGKPFTETMTTQRFMMTPALMELYSFLDAYQVDDQGRVTDRFRAANPTVQISLSAASGPIPIAETLDPKSPNFMHWYNPDVVNVGQNNPAGCVVDPIVYPPSAMALQFIIFGALDGYKNPAGAGTCSQRGGTATTPQLTAADFSTWKMVSIREPKAGEAITAFWDLPNLRTTSELVLQIPRVGFFSTPAFFANWQTNMSNQARVTANQMLIVALGAAIDGTDTTVPKSTPGLDAAHADTPACFACHQTLDPTRAILASTYSWNYHNQTEASYAGQKGLFVFQGVEKALTSVMDLGQTLASHPLFPAAWVQKLCYYVNSTACSTDDPEFTRLVDLFKTNNYQWNQLVREVMSSPIVTNAAPTKSSADHGEVIAVSRRDHLCAALNNRLGFTDVCGLDSLSAKQATTTVPSIVSGLPSDGYGRGSLAPVLPNQPSLFYRAGIENICEAVAAQVIDAAKPPPGVKQWQSTNPDAAIGEFVTLMMGLPPSDPRWADAKAALTDHFKAAKGQAGITAGDALKSTFVVSCLAPSAVSIGL